MSDLKRLEESMEERFNGVTKNMSRLTDAYSNLMNYAVDAKWDLRPLSQKRKITEKAEVASKCQKVDQEISRGYIVQYSITLLLTSWL